MAGPAPISEQPLSSSGVFRAGGYAVARGVASPETVALATRYALLAAELSPRRGDSQVTQSHARYGNPLMECLLEQLWPQIETLAGVELWPTYAYHRVYYPGAELVLHRDRPSCEISASLCLGFEYHDVGPRVGPQYRWPLQMQQDGQLADLALEPGDLVIYEGCLLPHARPRFEAGPGSFHAQVFLHFVRRDGRFAICKFDGRPRLGLPANTADPALEQRILELEREVLGDVSAQRGSSGA